MKEAMDYTLHHIWHILFPSKLSFDLSKGQFDVWLAKGLIERRANWSLESSL